jgi:hypothetical protein
VAWNGCSRALSTVVLIQGLEALTYHCGCIGCRLEIDRENRRSDRSNVEVRMLTIAFRYTGSCPRDVRQSDVKRPAEPLERFEVSISPRDFLWSLR